MFSCEFCEISKHGKTLDNCLLYQNHLRDDSFSKCAKFSEKLMFINPWYVYVRMKYVHPYLK